MNEQQFIKLIEDYADKHGLAPSTVTQRAVANSKLYHNLIAGKSCTFKVAARVEEYMNTPQPPTRRERAK